MMKNPIYLAISLVLLSVFGGAWLDGPMAWGFNLFAYLPTWYFLLWTILVAISFVPVVQNFMTERLQTTIPNFLFSTKKGPLTLTVFLGLVFYILQSNSYFLGDGYLILNLIEKEAPFRIFDNMDFFLHRWVFQNFSSQMSAEKLYRIGSVFGGVLSIPLVIYLLKQLRWESWRQTFALALFIFSSPVILFFGYIESYTYLYICITCFLISGLLYLENKFPLYIPSSFLGFALFFHLSAVFCGPALLSLIFLKPTQKTWKDYCSALLPPLFIFGISLLIHIQAGYSQHWFQHEFLKNEALHKMLISPKGESGFFSIGGLLNQWNLFLAIAPVSFLLIVFRLKSIFFRRGEANIQFLLIHFITAGLMGLVIDRKLGFARDWDLLMAHSASLYLLASLAISAPKVFPGRTLTLAIAASLFCTVPWIALEHSETFSITRFSDVAKGFPSSARAHAFEDLGQHFRGKGDLRKSLKMYDQCILADPNHYRYYALRGATNFSLVRETEPNDPERQLFIAQAEANFEEALRRKPNDISARMNLGKLLLLNRKPKQAQPHLKRIVEMSPDDPMARNLLALSLVAILEQDLSKGREADTSDFFEARTIIDKLFETDPQNKQYQSLQNRILKIGLSMPH